jgi:hypothetical protein
MSFLIEKSADPRYPPTKIHIINCIKKERKKYLRTIHIYPSKTIYLSINFNEYLPIEN